jgi:hypothetical protein
MWDRIKELCEDAVLWTKIIGLFIIIVAFWLCCLEEYGFLSTIIGTFVISLLLIIAGK